MSGFLVQLKKMYGKKVLKIYLYYVTYQLQLKCYIYNTCSKFNDVGFLLFIKSQFTRIAQSPLHLYQFTPWTRLIMDCRIISRSRSGCEWFYRHKNFFVKVSLHFQLELLYNGALKRPHRWQSERLRSTSCQPVPCKLSADTYWYTVGYARTNVIGSRTSFVIASVLYSTHWNTCI